MSGNPNLKSLAQKVSDLAHNVLNDGTIDNGSRRELQVAMKNLGSALENPFEKVQRIMFLPLQPALVRIGLNLKIFDILVHAGPSGKTIEELVAITGVDETLLPRLLRPLAAIDLLAQIDHNRYAATPLSRPCTIPPVQAGLKFITDFMGPVFQKLPAYLAETKYQIADNHGPLQATYDTDLSCFEYLMQPQNASILEDFNIFMKSRQNSFGASSWFDFYPFEERITSGSDNSPDGVLVVDVGGGLGHGLQKLRKKFPDLPGRLILQDLPRTIQQVEDTDGAFEPIAHDFFTPQPIQGARAYYLRQVLHDWPDDKCRTILQHTVAAMRSGYSKVIINECIIPDTGASEFISFSDVTMMAVLGGMERTESQWRHLLASVGLRLEQIWSIDDVTESVIEAVLS